MKVTDYKMEKLFSITLQLSDEELRNLKRERHLYRNSKDTDYSNTLFDSIITTILQESGEID